jgi:hypothetical protein
VQAGDRPATGLGFVPPLSDQGQQACCGNFLTILGMALLFATDSHHLVIALNEAADLLAGDHADRRRGPATRARPPQDWHAVVGAVLVFGLVFNIGRVLARLMPRCRSISSACRSDHGWLLIFASHHGDDGDVSELLYRRYA